MRWLAGLICAGVLATQAPGTAWAAPPDPAALLEPKLEHLVPLLEMQRANSEDAEAVLFALQMKLYGLFAAAPSGGLMIDYVKAQWAAMAALPDPELRARGAALIATACEAAYMRTLNLESNIPVEICEWTKDEARRDAMVHEGRVIP